MRRIATSENCSVSLADLWHRHTISDVLDYVEMLDWHDEMADRED